MLLLANLRYGVLEKTFKPIPRNNEVNKPSRRRKWEAQIRYRGRLKLLYFGIATLGLGSLDLMLVQPKGSSLENKLDAPNPVEETCLTS